MPSPEVLALQEASERALLAIVMSFLAYGIHAIIAFTSVYWIFETKGRNRFFNLQIVFIVAVFVLGTFNVSLWSANTAQATKAMFVTVDEALAIAKKLPTSFIVQGAGYSATALALTGLCNGLLIYRCYVIWGQIGAWIALPLAAIYVGTLGLGVSDVLIYWLHMHQHGMTVFTLVHRLTKAYWALVLSLNGLTTLLIVTRILWVRRTVTLVMGKEYGQTYTGVAACLVESSVLYTVAAIIGFAMNWWIFGPLVAPPQTSLILLSMEVSPFNPYLAHVECIASELIILRVALGRAWTQTTGTIRASDSEGDSGMEWNARRGSSQRRSGSSLSPPNFPRRHKPTTPPIAIELSPRLSRLGTSTNVSDTFVGRSKARGPGENEEAY